MVISLNFLYTECELARMVTGINQITCTYTYTLPVQYSLQGPRHTEILFDIWNTK